MATFLFWNINRKPLADEVHRLVERHRVDVLMLAECQLSAGEILASLNRDGGIWEFAAPIDPWSESRIQIYTRLGPLNLQELFVVPYATVRELNRPNSSPILLSVVHLPSKLWEHSEDQMVVCTELSRQFRRIESIVGHERMIAVGDLTLIPLKPL